MGKFIAKIAKVIGIAALVVGTILTAGTLAAGLAAGTLKGGFLLAFKNSAIRLAFSVAAFATGVSAALNKPKLNFGEQTAQRTQLNLTPNPSRKWIFGETAAAMDMIYAEVYGSNNEITTIVLAHAGHEITSYERIWIDGEIVTFSGNNALGRWVNLLTREQKLGTFAQTALSINSGARWTSNEKASGVAVQGLTFTRDDKNNPRGVPARIVQEIKGSPVYDPRLDTTEGGSGSHRADDQSTWEYANGGIDIGRNAVLVYVTYLIGWTDTGDTVLGVGVPVDDLLYDTFIEAANIAEANNWFFDGILTDGDHRRNLRAILTSFAGSPLEIGGRFGVRAPFDDTAVVALAVTADRIMGQVHRDGAPPFRERVNIARGRYVEPDNAFQPEEYPTVTLSDLVTIDGSELPMSLDFNGIQDSDTAQQLSGIMLREARQPSVRLVIDQTGLAVCPGDIISVTLPEVGFNVTLVRVASHNFSFEALTIAIQGNVVVSSDYDLVTPSAAADQQTPTLSKFDELANAVNLSGLIAVAVNINTLFGTVTSTERFGFALQWDNPGVDVLETQIQYKPTAESDFINAPSAIGDTNGVPNTAVITGIIADSEYDIRARHINVAGFPGDFQTIQESSFVIPLLTPVNLALTNVLTLATDGQYRNNITFTFDPDAGTSDLNVREYEVQFKLERHTEFKPLYKSLSTSHIFETAEFGVIQVRVRSVYITDLVFGAFVSVSLNSAGTFAALDTLGISAPVNATIYLPKVIDRGPFTARIEVDFDPTTGALPDSLVFFYAWEYEPNQLAIVTDNGSNKLFLDESNADTGISGIITDLVVASGSTDKIINYTDPTGEIDIDLSGRWWLSVDNGSVRTRYHKIVESSATQLKIPPEETLSFTPQAGDTIEILELDWVDSRLAQFKLAYFDSGEVINHDGIEFDGVNYFLDAVTRGAEGTAQADQSGKVANYFPAFGPGTHIIVISMTEFEEVDGVFVSRVILDLNLPAQFDWGAMTCCFVRHSTTSNNVADVRSNIVPFVYKGSI